MSLFADLTALAGLVLFFVLVAYYGQNLPSDEDENESPPPAETTT